MGTENNNFITLHKSSLAHELIKGKCVSLSSTKNRDLKDQDLYEARGIAFQCKQNSLKKSMTNQQTEGVSRKVVFF